MNKSEIALQLIKTRWPEASKLEREQIMQELKRSGLSIIEAIIALRSSGFLSLGEAKQYVSASPVWHVEVENSRDLQEAAWQVFEEFKVSQLR